MADLTRPGELLDTVEAIYGAALDPALWPRALEGVTRVIGGVGTVLELIDRTSLAHREFQSFGLPPSDQVAYLSHYAALNPRLPAALKERPGGLSLDYLITDERGIDRSLFYTAFLGPLDLRYTIGGILETEHENLGVVAVQRSPRQGHADRAEIDLMRCLAPHIGRALDMARRVRGSDQLRGSLEQVLHGLADGIVLVRRDGRVVLANRAAVAIARRNDGIQIARDRLHFATPRARRDFAAALAQVLRLAAGNADAIPGVDFTAPRRDGGPAYLVLVRPLARGILDDAGSGRAEAIVVIVDPREGQAAGRVRMREAFGLTDAEGHLAEALLAGTSPSEYARANALSANTVYTHLRRIKAKTGCTRVTTLIHKLNGLGIGLRQATEPGEGAAVGAGGEHLTTMKEEAQPAGT